MILTSTECEERNAHMFNTPQFTVGVLSERSGLSCGAQLVRIRKSRWAELMFFDFLLLDGTEYVKRDTDKYWDFTVKAGN